MCRTYFYVLPPQGQQEVSFFVEMPARVVKDDTVAVWPLMPVEMAANPAHDWLQHEGLFTVMGTSWSRDEHGIFLGATLMHVSS